MLTARLSNAPISESKNKFASVICIQEHPTTDTNNKVLHFSYTRLLTRHNGSLFPFRLEDFYQRTINLAVMKSVFLCNLTFLHKVHTVYVRLCVGPR